MNEALRMPNSKLNIPIKASLQSIKIAPMNSNAPTAITNHSVLTGRSTPILFQERVNIVGKNTMNSKADGLGTGWSDKAWGLFIHRNVHRKIQNNWHNSVLQLNLAAPMQTIAPTAHTNHSVLTREFHVDALRAQHEYRALGSRSAGITQ